MKRLRLGDLAPKLELTEEGMKTSSDGITKLANRAWGQGATDLNELGYSFGYRKLYEKIDSVLYYPSLLAYHDHEGIINFQVKMNKFGCEKPWLEVRDNNSYLKSYVSQLFDRLVCKPEFLAEVLGEETRALDFSIHFELTETSAPPTDSQYLQGNYFSYYRFVPKSKAEWNLGPIKGFGLVPAVSVDFIWLQEKWLEWNKRKSSLEAYK